jgi:hypothetical protein
MPLDSFSAASLRNLGVPHWHEPEGVSAWSAHFQAELGETTNVAAAMARLKSLKSLLAVAVFEAIDVSS